MSNQRWKLLLHLRWLLPGKKAVPMSPALTNTEEKLNRQIFVGNISIPKY